MSLEMQKKKDGTLRSKWWYGRFTVINGLLVSAQSAQSAETLYSYDALERRIGQFQVSGFTSQVSRTVGSFTHYNTTGQIDWTMDAASNKTWFAYDPNSGLKVAETNALNETTLYDYNDRGQVTSVGGSSQYPVEYNYDDFGRMSDLYTLRGATNGWDRTQWLYDNATGLVINKLYADNKGPSYTYTPDGKLATRTWARLYGSAPVATHYSYDALGSLTNTVYSDGTPSVSIAYNRLGQKMQVIDASGTNTFAYNSFMQLTNETVQVSGFTSQLSRSYDSLGRSSGISLSDPSSSSYAVQYSYDDVGRFSSVSSSVQSVSSVVDYSYLEGSSFISGYTNNSGLAVSYSFEDNRNLKTSVSSTFGTNTVSSFSYTYDEIGRRTQRIDVRPLDLGLSTNVFAYNSRSELTSAQMSTNEYDYGYDSIGNREFSRESTQGTQKETSYLANNLNQYLSTVLTNLTTSTVSTNLLSYDADGNLLSDGTSTYTWDGENRLIQASNATMIVAFKYDHQGRRFEKTVNATNTTRFVYDDWAMISEISNQNSSITTNSYVYGLDLSQSLQGAGGVGGLLSVVSKAQSLEPKAFFPCYDANGNVTDYVTTNGTVAAHYEYDAFGNTTRESIAQGLMPNAFPFRFSTKYFDSETQLSYYGFRYYNPELGRWLNRDPIGENGGINIYLFSLNDPVGKCDRLGRDVWSGSSESVGGSLLIGIKITEYYLRGPCDKCTKKQSIVHLRNVSFTVDMGVSGSFGGGVGASGGPVNVYVPDGSTADDLTGGSSGQSALSVDVAGHGGSAYDLNELGSGFVESDDQVPDEDPDFSLSAGVSLASKTAGYTIKMGEWTVDCTP